MFTTKQVLDNSKFTQNSGNTLTLSGLTSLDMAKFGVSNLNVSSFQYGQNFISTRYFDSPEFLFFVANSVYPNSENIINIHPISDNGTTGSTYFVLGVDQGTKSELYCLDTNESSEGIGTLYNKDSGNYSGTSLPDTIITSIYVSGLTSIFYIWTSGSSSGLGKFNVSTLTNTLFDTSSGNYTGDAFSSGSVTHPFITTNDYTGTTYLHFILGSALHRFNATSNINKKYTSISGNYTGSTLSSSMIYAFQKDNFLYAALNNINVSTGGIWKLNLNNNGAIKYTTTSGNYNGDILPNNSINGAVLSSNGNIWFTLGSSGGFWRYNSSTNTGTRFNATSANYSGDTFTTPIQSIIRNDDVILFKVGNDYYEFDTVNLISKKYNTLISLPYGSALFYKSDIESTYPILGSILVGDYILGDKNKNVDDIGHGLLSITTSETTSKQIIQYGSTPITKNFGGSTGGRTNLANNDFINKSTLDNYYLYSDSFKVTDLFGYKHISLTNPTGASEVLVDNGLRKFNNHIGLGGALTENTFIAGSGMSFQMGNFGEELSSFSLYTKDSLNINGHFKYGSDENTFNDYIISGLASDTLNNINLFVRNTNYEGTPVDNTSSIFLGYDENAAGFESNQLRLSFTDDITITTRSIILDAKGTLLNASGLHVGSSIYNAGGGLAVGGTVTGNSSSFAFGTRTRTSSSSAFAGGVGLAGGKEVIANNRAFNFSENTSAQVAGHGALALNSAILGGRNHNIPSTGQRSVILGGEGIKASAVTDTVYMPKVRIGLGTGGSLTANNSNNNLLVRNATTGEIEIRNALSISGGSGGGSGSTFFIESTGNTGMLYAETIGNANDVIVMRMNNNPNNDLIDGLVDVFLGPQNGNTNIWGGGNIGIGQSNLKSITGSTSVNNITIGNGNVSGKTVSSHNTIIGSNNGNSVSNTTIGSSILIGRDVFDNAKGISGVTFNTFGNVFLGSQTAKGLSGDTSTTALIGIGSGAFQDSIGRGGTAIAIGNALSQAEFEFYTIAIGTAGSQSKTGRANILIGTLAGHAMSGGTPGQVGVGTCQFNVAIGTHTLEFGSGEKGTFVGTEAGSLKIRGQANSGFGNWSLPRATGNYNAGLGAFAGYQASLTLTGSTNTFVGWKSSYGVAGLSNTIVLAHNYNATLSNRVYVGAPTQRVMIGAFLSGTTGNSIVIRNSGGELGIRSLSSITGNSITTAINGLTKSGNKVRLGGILTGTTTITVTAATPTFLGGANNGLRIESTSDNPSLFLNSANSGNFRNWKISGDGDETYRGLTIYRSTGAGLSATTVHTKCIDNGDFLVSTNGTPSGRHFFLDISKTALSIGNVLGGDYAFQDYDLLQGNNVQNQGSGTGNILKGQAYGLLGNCTGNIINGESYSQISGVSYSLLLEGGSMNDFRGIGGSILIGNNNQFNNAGITDFGQSSLYNLQVGNHNSASKTHHLFQWGTGLRNHYGLTAWSNWTYQPKFYFGTANVQLTGSTSRASFVIANGLLNNGSHSDPSTYHSHSFTHLNNGWTQINTRNNGFLAGGTNLTENDVIPKAALDVVSTTSGILVPRLTNNQFTGMTSGNKVNGLILYESTSNKFKFYENSNFVEIPLNAVTVLSTKFATTGNTGAGEDLLYRYTLPANKLAVDGDTISGEIMGTLGTNTNQKRLRLKFGATTIADENMSFGGATGGKWYMDFKIVRTGSATQKCFINLRTSTTGNVSFLYYATATATLSNSVDLVLTGEATATDDIVGEIFKLKFEPVGN